MSIRALKLRVHQTISKIMDDAFVSVCHDNELPFFLNIASGARDH